MSMHHDNAPQIHGDRDPELEQLLGSLDPQDLRPGFWQGFHQRVAEAARFELARRRRLADLTIAGTVTSWARAVVPSAVLAAAAAAAILLVVPAPPEGEIVVGVEELLSAGLEWEPTAAPVDEDPAGGVTFATAEIF